jgi:hypothetical protein
MFESTTLLLLWIACTYAIVQIFFGVQMYYKLSADNLHNQLVKRLDEIVHRVEVEQQGEVYYWFDQDNHKFLGQGKSDQEIIDVLKKRFPDHIFYLEASNHILCAKHNWIPQLANKSQ